MPRRPTSVPWRCKVSDSSFSKEGASSDSSAEIKVDFHDHLVRNSVVALLTSLFALASCTLVKASSGSLHFVLIKASAVILCVTRSSLPFHHRTISYVCWVFLLQLLLSSLPKKRGRP